MIGFGTVRWFAGLVLIAPVATLLAIACSSDSPGGSGAGAAAGTSGSNAGGTGAQGPGGTPGAGGTGTCDDGMTCTIDFVRDGECTHSVGPNMGATVCPAGQFCTVEDGCVAAPACANNADCEEAWSGDACKTNVACDAASAVCTFDVLDNDGDGHAPPVCGGGDCDDDDASRFPERSERCDGKDNDCDGEVDEDGASCSSELEECVQGACTCKTENECGSACVDKLTDWSHCGACDAACADDPVCENGACVCDTSGAPKISCAETCVDTSSDPEHCGGCDQPCPTDATCIAGACECPPGPGSVVLEACGPQCIDLSRDENNCGACANECPAGMTCTGGECREPTCVSTSYPCSSDQDCCGSDTCTVTHR